ncbi:hypothetical protein E2C01_007741 [Portunus trituberculatus]|uniref:Uncharacterized protein n=1 Tax=Portunus trituberculatus TaxID=210409 RepID=A0A5B7D185_PORTR|nr:hypothetical protein [Portunus trituberculatus]
MLLQLMCSSGSTCPDSTLPSLAYLCTVPPVHHRCIDAGVLAGDIVNDQLGRALRLRRGVMSTSLQCSPALLPAMHNMHFKIHIQRVK